MRADAVTSPRPEVSPGLYDQAFLVLLVAVSVAFAWIILPLFGAVLWGVILAIVFTATGTLVAHPGPRFLCTRNTFAHWPVGSLASATPPLPSG